MRARPVSLNEEFYEHTNALVGVARDVERCCLATYSFDLSRFEMEMAELMR